MGILDIKHHETFDLDDPRQTLRHREIIFSKPFLKRLYVEWYDVFRLYTRDIPKGIIVELGSGGGFLKELMPEVITSDVLELPGIVDQHFYAQAMPFESGTVSAILLQNVFHHIPDSALFLNEAKRVLKKGGRIIMVEPTNTWWSAFIYKTFHHEPFDVRGDWFIKDSGPLSGSNQALPYIVFQRDKKRFETEFPEFEIKVTENHTPIRYLLSGGVSKRQFVPDFSFGFFRFVEKMLLRITSQAGMFITIVVEKK